MILEFQSPVEALKVKVALSISDAPVQTYFGLESGPDPNQQVNRRTRPVRSEHRHSPTLLRPSLLRPCHSPVLSLLCHYRLIQFLLLLLVRWITTPLLLLVRLGLNSFPHVANSLLSFYAKSKNPKYAQKLFYEIKCPDSYSWTSLISAYMKVGCIESALRVFHEMPNRDAALWNAMVTGLAENDFGDSALEMFVTMHRAGVRSDQYGYVCVLSLCGKHDMVTLGKQVHSMVLRTGFAVIKESVVCALITMYFSCRLVDDASSVFEEAGVCDCVMYNAAIAGLVECGLDFDAVILSKQMMSEERYRPNELTFSSVMSCCDLNVFGKQVPAVAMKIGLRNSSLVGNATVAMYFRLGDSANGQLVFNEIDKKDVVSWNSLISGCSQHGFHESAVEAYDQMQRDLR